MIDWKFFAVELSRRVLVDTNLDTDLLLANGVLALLEIEEKKLNKQTEARMESRRKEFEKLHEQYLELVGLQNAVQEKLKNQFREGN